MTFSHYSREQIDELSPVKYEQGEIGVYRKPVGLWLSVDGEYDWQWWCENESFGIGAFRHTVLLRPDANVLVIGTLDEFDAFQRRYESRIASWPYDALGIDWEEVARDFSGIVIAPYQWSRRLGTWYYTWDCASACIWDLYALESWCPVSLPAQPDQQNPGVTSTVNSESPDIEKEKGGAK